MSSTTKTVTKAAGIMMAAILLSRILGVVREMVIASKFGVGVEVDAYGIAFQLPDLLYFLLSSGALSAAFIPVFTEFMTRGEEKEAWRVFSIVGTFIFGVLVVLIVVCEVLAPHLLPLVAPGVLKNRELFDLSVLLTRVVLPAQMFFLIGGLVMATLYSRQHFVTPALGPIIYNVGIICGGLFLAGRLGIVGLGWGVLVGSFVGNFLLQIVVVRRFGASFRPSLYLRHPGVVKVGKLALPVMLGLSLPYVDVIINRAFASTLGEGAVAALNYANRLMQMPLGVFAQASAVALFPTLAAQAARKEMSELRAGLNFGIRGVFFLTVPSSVLMIVLATPIVRMLFQHGEFVPSDAPYVAYALIFYSLGLAAWAGQAVASRGFYALQESIVPVISGTIVTFIFIPLNWLLMKPLGHGGLALATSIAVALHLSIMLEILRRRLGGLNGGLIVHSFAKVTLASLAAGGAAWYAFRIVGGHFDTALRSGATIGVFVAGGLGVLVYAGMVALLKVEEAAEVWGQIARRFRRKSPVVTEDSD
jgi:putative peptidoglycan lipid II flippase